MKAYHKPNGFLLLSILPQRHINMGKKIINTAFLILYIKRLYEEDKNTSLNFFSKQKNKTYYNSFT